MKKIFITGGGGYVGSVLVPFLLNQNYKVSVLDLMIYGEDKLNPHKNLKIYKGDIRDTNLLKKILPGHDQIIHLACISNDPSFELNPDLGKSINLDSFDPIVDIAKKSKLKKFIFASSSSVYGLKKEKNVTENVTLEPLTDYSKYKALCEDILFNSSTDNFCTTVIRPATVCGYAPRQRLDVVVNILTNLAYHKREITVFGGKQLRPNIHIKDMARAYLMLLETDISNLNKEVFNAGYENHTVNDIAKMVKEVIGEDVILKIEKTDDNRSYHISSKKIRDKLGFVNKYSIEDAIYDLKVAFDKKILKDTLSNENYFNIKKMLNIKLI